jgi:hypothetical protein
MRSERDEHPGEKNIDLKNEYGGKRKLLKERREDNADCDAGGCNNRNELFALLLILNRD